MNRLCVTATIKNSYPGAMVLFRGVEESLEAAWELGYDGIELALYRKDNIDVRQIRQHLKEYNSAIPVISTGQMLTMLGISFLDQDKEARAAAVKEFKGIIEVAAEFHADVNVSRVRGSIHEGSSYDEGMKIFTGCMEAICLYADKYGLNILLEQMNRYETNFLNSAEEVGKYIKEMKIPNLKIHADLFHMNIEDADMTKVLTMYAEHLGYIHFADSNRLAPGKGHLDFAGVVKTLKDSGYNGWIGIEVLPIPDAYTAAKHSAEYLRGLMG